MFKKRLKMDRTKCIECGGSKETKNPLICDNCYKKAMKEKIK
ncbi:hypothetical protein [Priestia koreensis]|nr:hypothetical protein [Priestia koreensis]